MKLNKLNIAVAALAAVALAGCKNEDLSRQHYYKSLEKTNKKGQMSS